MRSGGWAIGAGWAADRGLGEPPAPLHPVAWFGRGMAAIERRTYRPSRSAGVAHLAVGAGGAWWAGRRLERLIGPPAAVALAVALSVAGRMLADEAVAVVDAVDRGDLAAARARLPALVGRDPGALDEPEVLRAVVESLAENSVDAVVAPLLWAVVGGAPAVLAHRAVNTLDAMVGHRSERYERFGWASARLDDVLAFVPARLAALGVAALVPSRARDVYRVVRRDGPAHPSPNGGVIEAAVAAALDLRLGGCNRYGGRVEDRGTLGDGRPPEVADARRAIELVRRLGAVAALAATVGGRPSGSSRHVSLSSPFRVPGPVLGTAVSN